jgi:ribosomal RNA-processing protein 9
MLEIWHELKLTTFHRSISLWRTDKKKPVFSMPLVHGLQETISGTEGVVKSPRAVLSLGALRYGDVFASGE